MTITVLPMDATAGAPTYTAQHARQAQAALYGNPTGRIFGTRSGWRVGTLPSIVSVTSTTWTLNPCSCMIEPAAQLYQGAYGWASDAVVTGTVTPADGTNPRVDILYIQVNDSSAGDGSGGLSAPVSYLAGDPAPSGTQVAKPLPPRSFLVATIAVPKSGAGSPTVTLNKTYFVAAGAPLPVYTQAERDALTPAPADEVKRGDLGWIREIWDGATWQQPLVSTAPGAGAGWTLTGNLMRTKANAGAMVSAAIKAIYAGAGPFTINTSWTLAFTLSNTGYKPTIDTYGYFMLRAATTRNIKADCCFTIDPTGAVYVRTLLGQAASTVAVGDELAFNTTWNA